MKHLLPRAALLAALAFASPARAAFVPNPGCLAALDIPGAVHEARAVAIQADGKIVVAGYANFGANRDFLVARFHPDLSPDLSFNGTGYRIDDIQGLNDEAFSVLVQFDQKIVAGGYSRRNASKVWMAFARYNRDGSLDASFGPGGFSLIDITSSDDDQLRALALQPDGKILGAGFATNTVAVLRLLKDGNLDVSFDGDGGAFPVIGTSLDSRATGIALPSDGKMVVSGEATFLGNKNFLAVRFLSNGSPDSAFGGAGWVSTDIGISTPDTASSLVIQPDGKIVLAGTTNGNAALVRYQAAGSLDGTFGTGGKVVHNFGGSDTGDALTLDPAGNLLIGGVTLPPSNLAFARFRPDGSLDLSQIRDLSALDDRAWGIALPRSGKFLLAGSTDGPGSLKAVLALYNADGSQSCGVIVNPVSVFTATASGDSANGQVTLHWLNPSYGPYDRTVIRRDTAGCPATHNGGLPVVVQSDGVGAPGSFLDTVPLGTTYHYAAFVLDSSGQPSVRACASATPFDRTSGNVDWKYDTAISALSTPGLRLNPSLGESVLYVVSNDGVVHAIQGGTSATGGGRWPPGYRPFRIGGSAQARPPIVPIPSSSRLAAILGSQDGHVYAVDAVTGELIWKSPKLGTTIQAAPAVVLSAWGGGADLVFAGTRVAGQPNKFYALHPDDGTVAWAFDNGGGANGIGMIMGGASVQYASRRVYFTSAQGASGNTTWCLDYTTSPPIACWASFGIRPLVGGDIEAGAVLHQGTLYVSDTNPGNLIAVDPANGSSSLFYPLGGFGAKGFVFPQFGTPNLFASNSTATMSVRSGALNWQGSCIANPSTAIAAPFTDSVFVGSNEGKLFELSASAGSGCPTPASTCIGDCVSTIVGPPAYDVVKGMLYAGTDEGLIHAVRDTP